ncbi:hypothetical protein Tco_0952609 [Tanacetum coccineum]|uniref:Reverse transcriptase RNase H-like domain-containing protein n=1 Tax=Tanacetum coccineum TaxID=301880 RepID=A0ABQ5DYE4_9ASTR
MIVHTDHSSLRHLFKKQDAKPCLIRWILLLQEFYIEIKDRKGTKNVAADHLYRIENDKTSDDSEADDNFPGKTLMEVNTEDEPWFVDFAILYRKVISCLKGMTYQQKNKFFSDIKTLLLGGTLPLQKPVLHSASSMLMCTLQADDQTPKHLKETQIMPDAIDTRKSTSGRDTYPW